MGSSEVWGFLILDPKSTDDPIFADRNPDQYPVKTTNFRKGLDYALAKNTLIQKMLTHLWENFYVIISNSLTCSLLLPIHSWYLSQGILKNVNISMGVSLLEKTEFILWRPLEEDSNNILTEMVNEWRL